MKKIITALMVVLLVLAMVSPALAKSNSTAISSKASMFLALGYWEEYGCDEEYCWGSYKEVYVRDESPKSNYLTLEIYMYEFTEPVWVEGDPEPPVRDEEYYWNTFQIPRSDFVKGKNLMEGAQLHTMTADGLVDLTWSIAETHKERIRNTYATDGYRFSYQERSTYGLGTVSGSIFEEEVEASNYGTMGYVSYFEKIRQTY